MKNFKLLITILLLGCSKNDPSPSQLGCLIELNVVGSTVVRCLTYQQYKDCRSTGNWHAISDCSQCK